MGQILQSLQTSGMMQGQGGAGQQGSTQQPNMMQTPMPAQPGNQMAAQGGIGNILQLLGQSGMLQQLLAGGQMGQGQLGNTGINPMPQGQGNAAYGMAQGYQGQGQGPMGGLSQQGTQQPNTMLPPMPGQ